MKKTLFEKLTSPGEVISVRESVIQNIDRILSSGGFLDAALYSDPDTSQNRLDSIFVSGLSAIVDQSTRSADQLEHYRTTLRKVLLRFEPRLKNVTVSNIRGMGLRSTCDLKIELHDQVFEQQFEFGKY